MPDVQLEKGYTRVANQTLEGILQHNFNKQELRVLLVLFRFSYGFNKKAAFFDCMQDFVTYGIPASIIGKTLRGLEENKVIEIDWDKGQIWYKKDYDEWGVKEHGAFDADRHKGLLGLNGRHKAGAKIMVAGWNKTQHGGGRPAKKKLTDSGLGLRKVNLDKGEGGFKNRNPNKDMGYENENPAVLETETDRGNKVNEGHDPHIPKDNSKDIRERKASLTPSIYNTSYKAGWDIWDRVAHLVWHLNDISHDSANETLREQGDRLKELTERPLGDVLKAARALCDAGVAYTELVRHLHEKITGEGNE